jgi:hypothetical protein
MSQFVADHLPDNLVAWLSSATALGRADHAIVICTVDEHGWPHPAMLSTLEIVAKDASNIRIATHISSRSTRNLKANGILSMVLADQTGVYYIKGDAILLAPAMTVAPQNAKFNLRVDSVLQDNPHEYEKARIVSGIRIERDDIDLAAARAVLDELIAG